ncbi:hypothetical protein [Aulosira sp. FACHB-615]|uniref:hypothetical protein n=1 Tax=Aulosira sp. FACHB-615 TaxID=2692777 RepID=UPI001684E2C3|nr:hypothetical protein [Aulosira sp. FACHB-615]MBD2491595.1 hypothetical protein [Aulosira sp. FACHB-615]
MSQDLLTLPHPKFITTIKEDRCDRWGLMLCGTPERTIHNRRYQNAIALLDETLSAMINHHRSGGG